MLFFVATTRWSHWSMGNQGRTSRNVSIICLINFFSCFFAFYTIKIIPDWIKSPKNVFFFCIAVSIPTHTSKLIIGTSITFKNDPSKYLGNIKKMHDFIQDKFSYSLHIDALFLYYIAVKDDFRLHHTILIKIITTIIIVT